MLHCIHINVLPFYAQTSDQSTIYSMHAKMSVSNRSYCSFPIHGTSPSRWPAEDSPPSSATAAPAAPAPAASRTKENRNLISVSRSKVHFIASGNMNYAGGGLSWRRTAAPEMVDSILEVGQLELGIRFTFLLKDDIFVSVFYFQINVLIQHQNKNRTTVSVY